MLNLFGDIESLVSELYPYRLAVAPLVIAALLVGLFAAYHAGWHHPLLRHRFAAAVVAVPVLVVAVVAGDYLFSPLWERSYLNEESPLTGTLSQPAGESSLPVSTTDAAAVSPGIAAQGRFNGADDFHFGRGDARIIQTPDGKAVLRFENFSVRNGPDLYVYLSTDTGGKKVEESLNLGRLKATDGAFNYEIPDHVDLTVVKSVIVWCRQFSTLFAVAPLL